MEKQDSFLTTPVAILLGSILITMAILMHGGIIKIGTLSTNTANTGSQAAAQPAAPAPKSDADIVNGLKDQAKKLGLDTAKFASCLDSGSKAQLVKADLDDGTKVGVNGTPSFFINGRKIRCRYCEWSKRPG